jgi:hypothetical protein
MIRAIVAGERAPPPLAALRHYRGPKEAEEMALALTGPWRAEHLCGRGHALALFDCYPGPLSAGDAQIAGAVSVLRPRFAAARPASLPHAPTSPAPLAPPEGPCGQHPRPYPAHHRCRPRGRPRHERVPGADPLSRDRS